MITKKEYELLKYYRATGYSWIARDKNKELCVYEIKPMKLTCSWLNRHIHERLDSVCDDDHLFQYIKWEDEKPTKILDLMQDYEKQEELKGKVVTPQFVADWIEECKKSKLFFSNLNLLEGKAEVKNWIYEHGNGDDVTMKREEMVIKAYYDGYVVEKEKLYTVRLANGDCLCRIASKGLVWVLTLSDYKNDKKYQLTQSEIESIDPVLMQLAEEVE